MIKKILHFVMALVAAILALFYTTGCHSSKGAVDSRAVAIGDQTAGKENTIAVVGDSIPEGTLPARYKALSEGWKPWNDMEVNAKLQISSPAKLNGAGKVYMKRNQWVSVSVRMLGFEVASIWLDNDSIVFLDKIHKKYLSEPTDRIFGTAGVTVGDVQDILLGRAFLTGQGTATPADAPRFDLRQAENGWYLLPKKQADSFTYGFLASLTADVLRGAAVDVDGYGAVSADYADYFESRSCGWFAQKVNIENSRGKRIAATLKWDLNGAKFNTGLNKSCNIPSGYDRISLSSLVSMLKSF